MTDSTGGNIDLNALRDKILKSELGSVTDGQESVEGQINELRELISSSIGSLALQQREYNRFKSLPVADQKTELAKFNDHLLDGDGVITPETYLQTIKPYSIHRLRQVTAEIDLKKLLTNEAIRRGLSIHDAEQYALHEIGRIESVSSDVSPLEASAELVAMYECIGNMAGIGKGEGQIIYYPGCGTDIAPSKAFPEAKSVYYVDVDGISVATLIEGGYKSFLGSAADVPFENDDYILPRVNIPEIPTVVVLMNPSFNPEKPIGLLQKGGFAIVNNYHQTAKYLSIRSDMEFLGLVRKNESISANEIDNLESVFEDGMDSDSFFLLKKFNYSQGMKTEHHKRGISGYIKDMVYGANDGIITTFAVVTGATGAGLDPKIVIILGLANLFADGFSMGASNYLGERSENNFYHEEEKKEFEEIGVVPDIEKGEVLVSLKKFNFSDEDAKNMTDIISKNKKFWVDFMMKYELEMGKPSWGKEWRGATVTFFAFVIAGSLPLLSFFFADPTEMFVYSVFATAIALFVVGSLRFFITRKNWFISGLEMLFVGGVAAAVSYGVGYVVSLIVG